MPIQLNYTDPDLGFVAPNSYWINQVVNIDINSLSVFFQIAGYVSLAAKNAGRRTFGVKNITATFAQLGITGASTLVQVNNALYNFALTFNDGTGIFFSGGTIV